MPDKNIITHIHRLNRDNNKSIRVQSSHNTTIIKELKHEIVREHCFHGGTKFLFETTQGHGAQFYLEGYLLIAQPVRTPMTRFDNVRHECLVAHIIFQLM